MASIGEETVVDNTATNSLADAEWVDEWVVSIHHDEIDSTQTFVENEHGSFDQGKLTIVSADLQTAGRGTRDRKWLAQPGQSVLATFFFRFPAECDTAFVNRSAPNVTQVLAVSAVSALRGAIVAERARGVVAGDEDLPDANLGTKWPNDIILNGGKIGGILARAVPFGGRLEGIIVGIGININTDAADLRRIDRPVWPATSLRAELGRSFEVASIRVRLANSFASSLRLFFAEGFPVFRSQVNQLDVLCGTAVNFRTSETEVEEGVYEGIDDDGQLLLRLSQTGEIRAFPSGELVPRHETA